MRVDPANTRNGVARAASWSARARLIPDLPSGASYQWFVAAFGPFDTVDGFTGGANLFPVLGDSFQTVSVPRTVVSN
jgi:hypothetical protein